MSSELVTIAEFASDFEAYLAKMRLDAAGIESTIVGDNLAAGAYAGLPFCRVELQVASDKAEDASEILKSKENNNYEE